MKIVVTKEMKNLGITSEDVLCMLKAASKDGIVSECEEYKPTVNEMARLLLAASKAELEKKRRVDKWLVLVSEFMKFMK